jgi:hypothetical protein
MEMVALNAAFWRGAFQKKALENTAGNAHHASYSPISTPNSTALRSTFQRASSGKLKNIATSRGEGYVL